MFIIPHINLPLKTTNQKIKLRDELYTAITNLENENVIDLTKECLSGLFMEDVLLDGFHFDGNAEIISCITKYVQGN